MQLLASHTASRDAYQQAEDLTVQGGAGKHQGVQQSWQRQPCTACRRPCCMSRPSTWLIQHDEHE